MIAFHAILSHGGFGSDGPRVARMPAVASLIGGGAGQAIVTAVVLPEPWPDANYTVLADVGQDAVWFVTNKTRLGFDFTLRPRLAASTLAVGVNDLIIIG